MNRPTSGRHFILPAIMEIPMAETSSPDFLSDERFIKEHRRVFVMFMGRDGYSEQMSTEEFPRLRETSQTGCLLEGVCAPAADWIPLRSRLAQENGDRGDLP
jgi:hypothetical protein